MDTALMRLRIIGIVLAVAGLAVAGAAFGYGTPTANAGLDSAQAMYEAQGVTLSYNDEGQLVDRGTTEGAQETLRLLEEEWKYPVNHANLDPSDPLVNTRDELMYQYATIAKHVLHREMTVTLGEEDVPISYRGVTYTEPGEYKIEVGAYFAELDRQHPIEGQLRAAWDPMALSLLSSLAGGHANQATGELAAMVSLGVGSIGLLFTAAGSGLVWVSYGVRAVAQPVRAPAPRGVPRATVTRVRPPTRA